MKTLLIAAIVSPALTASSGAGQMNSIGWYVAGALIAILLLAYLMVSLIKPEKF